MKVRTLRDHDNSHPPSGLKTHGRIYDVPDAEAQTLIDTGYVEKVDENSDQDVTLEKTTKKA